MRIGLQTWGSHGDIRPFIALVAGLEAAGHQVTLAVFTGAVREAGCRAVIQLSRWQECGSQQTPDIHFVTAAPHNLVFPRCAAVVHHGGSGTTQAATTAGVPSVVVAHIAEQTFWGRELARIGVARPH